MFMISSLNRAKHVHSGNVGAGEGAIMHYLFDAGAGSGDLGGEIGKATGTIADHSAKTA
jgi:L-aminopeptidase/D-esterase-like protein